MDEGAKLLLQDKREHLPIQPGQPERVDFTFESAGMQKLFLACEPLAGKRFVAVTKRRTSEDWAHFIHEIVDVHYPTAEKIVLVIHTLHLPCTKPSPQRRHVAFSKDLKSTTRPSMEVG